MSVSTAPISLADVQTIAVNQMAQHGLLAEGWFFSFDRAKKRLGACHYGPKKITLSAILTPTCTPETIQNTILHEIAHALVGHKAGHGPVWKAKAISIGCDGKRCGTAGEIAEKPEFRWIATCPGCFQSLGMHRAPGRVRACIGCNPTGFNWNFRFKWTEWGVPRNADEMPIKFYMEYKYLEMKYADSVYSELDNLLLTNEDANV